MNLTLRSDSGDPWILCLFFDRLQSELLYARHTLANRRLEAFRSNLQVDCPLEVVDHARGVGTCQSGAGVARGLLHQVTDFETPSHLASGDPPLSGLWMGIMDTPEGQA